MYEPSVAEDPDEDKHHGQHMPLPTAGNLPPVSVRTLTARDKPRSDSSGAGWQVVRPTAQGKGGTVYEVGPLQNLDDMPDSAV